MSGIDPVAITWGLFRKLEEAAEQDRDLPDDEVEAFLEAAEAEIGTSGLLSGWAILAALLRQRLIEHAPSCDCGSDAWLAREQLRLAAGKED